jgi:hypothetical protein
VGRLVRISLSTSGWNTGALHRCPCWMRRSSREDRPAETALGGTPCLAGTVCDQTGALGRRRSPRHRPPGPSSIVVSSREGCRRPRGGQRLGPGCHDMTLRLLQCHRGKIIEGLQVADKHYGACCSKPCRGLDFRWNGSRLPVSIISDKDPTSTSGRG